MEEWRAIPGMDGRYEVSRDGHVRSLARKKPRMLAVCAARSLQGKEYAVVQIKPYGGVKYVHRLVLETFVGPCPPGCEARHLDDDGMNPKMSNLAWGTRKQNAADRKRNGAYQPGHGLPAKLTEEGVRHIRAGTDRTIDLARQYGVTQRHIAAVRRRVCWGHLA